MNYVNIFATLLHLFFIYIFTVIFSKDFIPYFTQPEQGMWWIS